MIDFNLEVFNIFSRSLAINVIASIVAVIIGCPIGAMIGLSSSKLALFFRSLARAFLGLPPVVVGLLVYISFSKGGVLAFLDLLYTPQVIVIAQIIIILPISIALTESCVRSLHGVYSLEVKALLLKKLTLIFFMLSEVKADLFVIFFTCFGRALSEVGAALIVGGNIRHATRIATTSIAMETSRGNTSTAITLGLLLVSVSVILHLTLSAIGSKKI